jgi:hypothetical protein
MGLRGTMVARLWLVSLRAEGGRESAGEDVNFPPVGTRAEDHPVWRSGIAGTNPSGRRLHEGDAGESCWRLRTGPPASPRQPDCAALIRRLRGCPANVLQDLIFDMILMG